jgi:peptidoglycan DL-endopeptidase CwlO
LRRQAVLAYLTGGAPLTEDLPPGGVGADTNLAVSYAEIVAQNEHRTISAYQSALAEQTRQSRQLTENLHQSAVAVADLRTDQNAATKVFAARQSALALVKGRLAVLVAQVQATQQRDEQSAIQAKLARQGQSLPTTLGAVPISASPASTTSTTASTPSSPGTGTTPASPTTRPSTPTPPVTRRTTTPSNPPPSAPQPPPPPTTRPPTTTPRTTPTTTRPPAPPSNLPAPGWRTAVAYAYAQLGKPYRWGGAGPVYFDCSGLTMRAWDAAGIYFPHLAQYQYDLTERIPLSDALPGDLIFYGTPSNVHHVGMYIGGGEMIDAPEQGQNVSISSIYWSDLLGAGRVIG